MQLLGIHVISDAELNRRLDKVRAEQRRLESAITHKLLRSAEAYRKVAEQAMYRRVKKPCVN